MANVLSIIDFALSAIQLTDKIARGSLATFFWVAGRIVNALTSRQALRLYAAVWGAIVFACISAYESGRIVGSGYYGIEEEEVVSAPLVLPTTRIAGLLAPAPEPVAVEPRVIYLLPAVLITPAPVKEVVAPKQRRSAPVSSKVHGTIDLSQYLSTTGKPLTGAAFNARMKKLATV